MLKIFETIVPVIVHIFNTCIVTGIYPDKMKLARVVPIFKSGERSCVENYRAISNLIVFNKIFERLIYNRMIPFLDSNNILSPSQYGFKKLVIRHWQFFT